MIDTDLHGVAEVSRELDVTDPTSCKELARQVHPNLWINNAGVLGSGSALDQTLEEITRVIDVNLKGVINGTRAAAQTMLGEHGGVILNIGSLSSWNPTPGLATYAATKHAVRAYSSALSVELAGSGVKVLCLCPDGIWTPMLHAAVSSKHSVMPFSGRRLLSAEVVATAAIELIEGGGLVKSIPQGRATLAKLSGLWPSIGIFTKKPVERKGRRNQLRYQRSLEDESGDQDGRLSKGEI